MEQTLAFAQYHLQDLLDSLPDALLLTTMDGVITTSNQAASVLLRTDFASLIGQPLLDRIAVEDQAHFVSMLGDILSLSEPWPLLMNLAGQTRDMVVSVVPIASPHADGQKELRWIFREPNTESLQQTTAQLRSRRDQQDHVISSIPGLVWEYWKYPDASHGRLNFVSPYVEKMLGYRVEEWLEDPDFWMACIHSDDRDRVTMEIEALQTDGQEVVLQFRWVAKNGNLIWVDTHAVVIVDETQKIVGLRGVSLDITPHKLALVTLQQRVEELALMTEVLERKNQELDQFAYITSHDLKAPLRGIANLSRWIEEDLDGKLPQETSKQFEMLRGRAQRMEAMIEGILQYSRVGRVTVRAQMVDVGRLLKEVITLLAPPPEFVIEIVSEMPTLFTEEIRLEQVLMNLIGNAIKHHDRSDGHVWISAHERDDCVEFTIKDDGPGIAPQYHERVFVIFQTLLARDLVENTGVGLALVKKIVENQGGVISLESDENAGSTFRFTWIKRNK